MVPIAVMAFLATRRSDGWWLPLQVGLPVCTLAYLIMLYRCRDFTFGKLARHEVMFGIAALLGGSVDSQLDEMGGLMGFFVLAGVATIPIVALLLRYAIWCIGRDDAPPGFD